MRILCFIIFILQAAYVYAQPIPVEFMAGNRYATANVVVSKNFKENSPVGFFHLNTLTMDYKDRNGDDLALQNLLFYEPVSHFRITGGAFYATKPGFSPTVGMQYIYAGKNWFVLCAPRVNLESDPSYNVFSILRYKRRMTEQVGFFASVQALNIFDAAGHIKSYQWTRIGLEMNRIQFGLAANFDEFGPNPDIQFRTGFFIRREIW